MGFDNGTANRQPHAHAVLLSGKEGIEQSIHLLGPDAYPGVPDCHQNLVCSVGSRPDPELAGIRRNSRHRLDAVHNKVDEDLLELNLIADNQCRT